MTITAPTRKPPSPPLSAPPDAAGVIPAITLGVAGHRRHATGQLERIRAQLDRVLAQFRAHAQSIAESKPWLWRGGHAGVTCNLLSSLAEGSDRIAAERAIAAGYRLGCTLPFPAREYERDFPEAESIADFRALLSRAADRTIVLDHQRPADTDSNDRTAAFKFDVAYADAAERILEWSDVLIAIWDGTDPVGVAGTAAVVNSAKRKGIPVVWINSAADEPVKLWWEKAQNQWLTLSPATSDQGDSALKGVVVNLLLPPPNNAEGLHGFLSFHGEFPATYLAERPKQSRPFYARAAARFWPLFFKLIAPSIKQPGDSSDPGPFLGTHYQTADSLAIYFANLHRGAVVVNCALGALVLTFASLSAVWPPHSDGHGPGLSTFIVGEVICILMLLINYGIHRRLGWHRKLTDYRLLAEQLRHMSFLQPLGLAVRAARVPDHHATEDAHWSTWYSRMVLRELGLPRVDLNDAAQVDAARLNLDKHWLAPQVAYHANASRRWHRLGESLHGLALILFVLSILACGWHLLNETLHIDLAGPWLTLTAIVCPAWGAAAHFLAHYLEVRRLHQRSHAMHQRLESLQATLTSADKPVSAEKLTTVAREAGESMLQEAAEWRIQINIPVLTPT